MSNDYTSAHSPALNNVKLRIATGAITCGGLAHYLAGLDAAMRSYVPQDCEVVGSPFVDPLDASSRSLRLDTLSRSLRRSAVSCLKVLPPLYATALWAYAQIPRRRRDADGWQTNREKIDNDIVCLIPHAAINDLGRLDRYYAEISVRTFVWVIHDLHGYHFPDQWRPEDIALMQKRFSNLASRAAAVIVHNEYTAKDVMEKLAIPGHKIFIAHLPAIFSQRGCIDGEEKDAAVLKKYEIDAPYALWASSYTFSHKNHERLLSAWRLLGERQVSLKLVCTGSKAPRWEVVRRLISDLRLEDRVIFTDVVSNAELGAIMRNAKLAVCPTLFEGGGCGPASEAILAGIPVVVSDIPQIMEQFNGRKDLCTFFDPNSVEAIAGAVQEVLNNYESAIRRSQWAAREFPMMRSWEAVAEVYWNAVVSVSRNQQGECGSQVKLGDYGR
jgi:glycosyltransferase involved in cell wall biosynthesis